jgi:hypothetical protein
MLSANDIKIFPAIAVIIPINDDQRCSCESPFESVMKYSKTDKAVARDRGAGVKKGDIVASKVEVDKYITAAG